MVIEFFTTDLISKLVKESESTIDAVFPPPCNVNRQLVSESEKIEVVGEGIVRNTVAAPLNMQEIRKGSSTYGCFSVAYGFFPS
ncbi:hypothetical protein P3S67_020574 [Capsicum chacoense]